MSARHVLGCAVVFVASVCSAEIPEGFAETASKFERSVVHIEAAGYPEGGEYEVRHGTGFFVAKGGFLLTAGHVVKPADGWEEREGNPSYKLFALNEEGQVEQLPVTPVVLYVDEQVDLALLRVIGESYVGLPLGNSGKVDPEKDGFIGVLAFGNSSSVADTSKTPEHIRPKPWAGTGTLSNAFRADVYGCMEIVLQNLWQSDSGSPLVDRAGKVVAVLVKGWDRLPDTTQVFAMPINSAAPLLSMAGRNHPTALVEWLRDTPSVEQTIRELEGAIHELRTSWTFAPAVAGVVGGRDRLEIVVRKRMQTGYWPEVIKYWVTPTVVLDAGLLDRESEATLEPIEHFETFEPTDTNETQLIVLKNLRRLIREKIPPAQREKLKRVKGLSIQFKAELNWKGEEIVRSDVQVVEYR